MMQPEASVLRQTCKPSRMDLAVIARRASSGATMALVFLGLTAPHAAAGSRGVGAGIAGAILLNEFTKGSGKRKAAKPQRSNKTLATKPKKQRPKQTKPDARDDVATAKNEPASNAPPKEALTSTGTAAKAAAVAGGAGIISRPDEIRAAQQHLRFMGYDIPQESGAMDVKTKSAVMQFQDSIGAPVTGELTTEQLQTLFVKVAGKREGS